MCLEEYSYHYKTGTNNGQKPSDMIRHLHFYSE